MAPSFQRNYASKELFRYVKIKPPRIIDLKLRAKKTSFPLSLLDKPENDQKAWAKDLLKSGNVIHGEEDLSFDYFSYLNIENIPVDKLPSRNAIKDPAVFEAQSSSIARDANYKKDHKNVITSLMVFRILKEEEKEAYLTRILNFIELFPNLHKASRKTKYAPLIFKKLKPKISVIPTNGLQPVNGDIQKKVELKKLATHISMLWNAKAGEIREEKVKLENAKIELPEIPVKTENSKAKNKEQQRALNRLRSEEYQKKVREKKQSVSELHESYNEKINSFNLAAALEDTSENFYKHFKGKSREEVAQIQKEAKNLLEKFELQPDSFYRIYDEVAKISDVIPMTYYSVPNTYCFNENPNVSFTNFTRVLGKGELIKVEETFVKYTPGEISYIENVLAGEIRKREVKNKNYFEQVSETSTEETFESTDETSTNTSNELSAQIESEISTRFNSDLNSSVNASGGGTIGVVDVEGGASFTAGMGVGLDTSFSSSNTSDFSQEIVNKAIEKTKKITSEKRMFKSYSLFETTNYHEINNSVGNELKSRNGVYCFLDKHVCISETPYGYRQFLLANLMLPGKNLLCEKNAKLELALSENGIKPEFEIAPNDIQTFNYKDLVGKYKANNVQPPPDPIVTIGKTYKTDTSNANVEQNEIGFKKVAEVLVPFFEKYKRFLITDNIALPDGYRVREVVVTVNHGANGISIPAHLPLSLAGAALYASPTLASGALFPPYFFMGLWQVGYLMSPILHYNSDSSNVTACIGNESQDYPYFFFEPDFLIREIFDFMSNFSSMGPGLLEEIKKEAEELYELMKNNAEELPGEVKEFMEGTVSGLLSKVKAVFDEIYEALNLLDGDISVDLDAIRTKINDLSGFAVTLPANLVDLMKDFFAPLQSFIKKVFTLLLEAINNSISDLFSFLQNISKNSQTQIFSDVKGMKKELPVSFNAIAMKPGVTINMNIHLERTEEALDKWRLATFNSLYQAYLQQMAEYNSMSYFADQKNGAYKSPGLLRQEENLAIKELVMHTLNNQHNNQGNNYTLEKINLFENAIDWKNMSYKLYSYGPNLNDIMLEKQGVFAHVDEKRKVFLKASWAQVLIPLKENEHLEKQILEYISTGEFDFEGELTEEELVALYTDVTNDRNDLGDPDNVVTYSKVVPTDFVILENDLPENDNVLCDDLQ